MVITSNGSSSSSGSIRRSSDHQHQLNRSLDHELDCVHDDSNVDSDNGYDSNVCEEDEEKREREEQEEEKEEKDDDGE